MKLKIVDRRKFVKMLTLLGIVIILLGVLGFNRAYSKGNIQYKEEYIYQGDTLWSIAEKEAKDNKYYENEDIRNIICELKQVNHIDNGNLEIGQKIVIPTF